MPPHKRTRLGLARSFQLPKPFASMTVLENLAIPIEYVAHRGHHKVSTKAEAASVHEDAMEILELIGLADRANHNSKDLTQIDLRSEEHTSELQSLMRISYAVFCLKKKK